MSSYTVLLCFGFLAIINITSALWCYAGDDNGNGGDFNSTFRPEYYSDGQYCSKITGSLFNRIIFVALSYFFLC